MLLVNERRSFFFVNVTAEIITYFIFNLDVKNFSNISNGLVQCSTITYTKAVIYVQCNNAKSVVVTSVD